jgi:predicted ester cyclase
MAWNDSESLIRDYFDCFNRKDYDRAATLMAPNATATVIPFGLSVPLLELMRLWATAFPDGRVEVSRILGTGDAWAIEYLGSGTNDGEFKLPSGSLPPSHRSASLQFIEVHRIENGKLAETRQYFDALTLCAQLDVDPRIFAREPIGVGAST